MLVADPQLLCETPPAAEASILPKASRTRARSTWQWLVLISGLLLAASFFLPVNMPSHPSIATLLWIEAHNWRSAEGGELRPAFVVFGLFCLLVFYAAGGFIALGAAGRLCSCMPLVRVARAALRGMLIATGLAMLYAVLSTGDMWESHGGAPPPVSSIALGILLLLVSRPLRRWGRRAELFQDLLVTGGCFGWFLFVVCGTMTTASFWISLAASAVLWLSTIGEFVISGSSNEFDK